MLHYHQALVSIDILIFLYCALTATVQNAKGVVWDPYTLLAPFRNTKRIIQSSEEYQN